MSSPPHLYVVTSPVPPGSSDTLRVEVADHTATAVASPGFRHTFELPRDVAVEALGWQVHADVLRLGAPYRRSRP